MISKILQILGLQPRISKVFVDHYKNFFLTVGQNNFSNKIPLAKADINCLQLCILQDSCWVWQQAFSIKKYQNDLINSWKKILPRNPDFIGMRTHVIKIISLIFQVKNHTIANFVAGVFAPTTIKWVMKKSAQMVVQGR